MALGLEANSVWYSSVLTKFYRKLPVYVPEPAITF